MKCSESYDSDQNEAAVSSGSYSQRGSRTTEINATNEEEFPALKSRDNQSTNQLSLTRPPPPSFINRSRISGLARTQENFPSLSGVNKANDSQKLLAGSNPSTSNGDNSGQQLWSSLSKPSTSQMSNASNGAASSSKTITTLTRGGGEIMLGTNGKKLSSGLSSITANQKSITGNSNSSGVVNYATNTGKKGTDHEFPALPASKFVKKLTQTMPSFSSVPLQTPPPATRGRVPTSTKIFDEDFIQSTSRPQFNIALQSKHCNLVDDYVSDVDPTTLRKIQLIKLDETNANKPPEKRSAIAPKLNEMEFPSLSGNNNNNIKSIGNNFTSHGSNSSGTWMKPLVTKNATENKNKGGSSNPKTKSYKEGLLQNNSNKNNNSSKKETTKVLNIINNSNSNNNCSNKEKRNKETINMNNENNKKNNNIKKVDEVLDKNSKKQMDKTQKAKTSLENGVQNNNVTLNSVAKSPNNFTFTTSMGESFNILPGVHSYTPPSEAFERNMVEH